ncbi:MAG: gamma-glutamyltransferase [Gemmatimonadota bacterium]|jgi:gamma-glutamyltranspeptidase/glutathione hydrolase
MVVSGNPQATLAGVRVLEEGGNAVDAAVVTALALGVVEPSQSGLGGRTQILVGLPDGTFHGIDGTTQIPAGYDEATAPRVERGYATVAVPGTVRGLARALREHGTLSWEAAVRPAIHLAEGGFVITEGEARRLRANADALSGDEELAALFLPGGTPVEAGDTVINPPLGRTLATLAREGPEAFYTGSLARRMADDLAARGAFVTATDLAEYRAEDVPTGTGRYGEIELVGTWLPASGVTTVEVLQILDQLDLGGEDEARWAAALAQALLAGFRDRERAQRDPPEAAVARLTDGDLAGERAAAIRLPAAGGEADTAGAGAGPGGGGPGSPAGAAPSALPPDPVPDHTTHVSVADAGGRLVAMTQSLGPSWGAAVGTPGLGFPYAATLGGYLADLGPGGRAWSSQSPLLAYRSGEPWLVIGGGGARRIISAIVSTVARMADQGLSLDEALAAPRLHPSGRQVVLERGRGSAWAPSVARGLESVGFTVRFQETGTFFARLNAVGRTTDGRWIGAADPRWPWSLARGPRPTGR